MTKNEFDQEEVISPSMDRIPVYKETQLTYNDYLQVPELLSLQNPQSSPAHHDEYLFIIIHQSYELWFKLILHELTKTAEYMADKKLLRAHHFMKRAVEIMKMLVPQIHMLETMTPVDFLYFRDRLNPASGFQSMQFREIEFFMGLKNERYLKFFENRPDLLEHLTKRLEEDSMRDRFYQLFGALGFDVPSNVDVKHLENHTDEEDQLLQSLLELYRHPEKNMALYLLTEDFVDFDEYLCLWRDHHVRVVSRIIGDRVGTGGSTGVHYLKKTTEKKCFPYLWRVRSLLMLDDLQP